MRQFIWSIFLLGSAFLAPAAAQPPTDRPFDVPDINGMAVTLVKPAFPETAVAANADGEAAVLRVVVDENGNVIRATCSLTCHAMLKDAAEFAAMQSKFKPLIREGRPVRYQGTLVYTFVVNRVDWFRFGTSLESTRQFDNLSLGPVAQILSSEFAKEKASLLSIDANGGADYDTRQKIMTEVTGSIRSRLKGMDLWRYEFGMALRRVTFWPQASGPVNRPELQEALEHLSAVTSVAPEGVSASIMKELTVISKYRIPVDISERDLRKAIMEMSKNLIPHLR